MGERWATDEDVAYERRDGFLSGVTVGLLLGAFIVGAIVWLLA